jgi:hypothetical protein
VAFGSASRCSRHSPASPSLSTVAGVSAYVGHGEQRPGFAMGPGMERGIPVSYQRRMLPSVLFCPFPRAGVAQADADYCGMPGHCGRSSVIVYQGALLAT